MNKKQTWAILGAVIVGLILLGLGYEWGQRQVPSLTPQVFPSVSGHRKIAPISELFNGLTLQTNLVTPEGKETAAVIKTQVDSYRVEITVRAVLPQPALSAQQISQLVPTLPKTIPGFDSLMKNASLSGAFARLYENKITVLRQNLAYLDRTVSRQNFYDCQTILNLQNSLTGRRAILGIGPMDVDTDGSDGDRNVRIEKSSLTFQPTTTYRWPKTTKRINPFVSLTEREIEQTKRKLARHDLSSDKTLALNQRMELLIARLRELKRWSFLVSTADPFIVIPGFFLRDYSGPFAPKIGDFAIVLFGGIAYPAIIGDIGPSYKFGEASFRICQQINKASSGINRAVSSLRVAYLVFPGTALKPWQTPNLYTWNARCTSLFEDLGGDRKKVFQWQNNIPPWPSPTPRPTHSPHSEQATPHPAPSSSLIPSVSTSPAISPSPSPPPASVTPTSTPGPFCTPLR